MAPKNAPTYIDELKYKKKDTSTIPHRKHKCLACGYIYDPEIGDETVDIPPSISFDHLPDDWLCPTCGSFKETFAAI